MRLYQRIGDRDGVADSFLILCQVAYEQGELVATWEYLHQAEEMLALYENGFREVRTFSHRAKLYLEEGQQTLAEEWLRKAIQHPACEWSLAQKAEAALKIL